MIDNYDSIEQGNIGRRTDVYDRYTLTPFGLTNEIMDFVDKKVKFEGFSFEVYSMYADFIKSNLTEHKFRMDWKYRPSYVSSEFYDTINLDTLILFVNGVDHPIDFTEDNVPIVYVPTANAVKYLFKEVYYMQNKIKTIEIKG